MKLHDESTRRIRVLRIIARMNVGGPALHAALLTERLDPARYESTLVAGREDSHEGNYLELHEASLARLITVPALGRAIGWRDAAALATLVRIMRRVRPDIVHTHTAKAGTLGRLAARITRVPVVVHTYHGHVFQGYFSPVTTRVFLGIERWLARRTDRLVTVSGTVRRELLGFGIGQPEQVCVIPLGLELDRFVEARAREGGLRRELGVSRDTPLVGIVARLVPIKGHELFLSAAAAVAGRIPEARFVIVGDGERRAELEADVNRRHLEDRVCFLGWRRDLDRVHADLDLVVLTSRNEGSPVALIEAMAGGRAVVSTRVGGVPDLIVHGETGWLVPPDDPTALADAVTMLLGDPDRRAALGAAGRARVVPGFSAVRLLGDIDRLYSEALADRASRRR